MTDITFDTKITDSADIWENIQSTTHRHNRGHLLVGMADHAAVGLPIAKAILTDPRTRHPALEGAHLTQACRDYEAEQAFLILLKDTLLTHLEEVLPDVYADCLTLCGGLTQIHDLTIPQITTTLRAEITDTTEDRQVQAIEDLKGEDLIFTEPSPCRALENRIKTHIRKLLTTGYTMPASELMRVTRSIFLLHVAISTVLQQGLTKFYSDNPEVGNQTGTRLLSHMTALEKASKKQGAPMFTSTTTTQHYASKAALQDVRGPPVKAPGHAAPNAALQHLQNQLKASGPLSTTQDALLMRYMEAAVSVVNLAKKHPTATTLAPKFCPIHGFNNSHDESACLKIQHH